jgi:hypothetical protein
MNGQNNDVCSQPGKLITENKFLTITGIIEAQNKDCHPERDTAHQHIRLSSNSTCKCFML